MYCGDTFAPSIEYQIYYYKTMKKFLFSALAIMAFGVMQAQTKKTASSKKTTKTTKTTTSKPAAKAPAKTAEVKPAAAPAQETAAVQNTPSKKEETSSSSNSQVNENIASAFGNENGFGFAKGDLFFSGSIGYNSTKTGDVKTSEMTFAPIVGYFITENIAIGGQLSFGRGTSEDELDNESKTTTFGINAIGRYYLTPANRFSVYGQANIGFSSQKMDPDGGEDIKSSGWNIGVGPGFSYFLSDRIAMEAGIGLLGYSSQKPDEGDNTNTFEFGLDMANVNFGIIWKL